MIPFISLRNLTRTVAILTSSFRFYSSVSFTLIFPLITVFIPNIPLTFYFVFTFLISDVTSAFLVLTCIPLHSVITPSTWSQRENLP